MKICAIICEYNPLHNGHLYQIQEAKRLSNADAILCIMSGNFVERGQAAVFDKYTRAQHAILSGADAVIELPTVFATSPAEIFALGAIKILSSIPDVKYLAFGAEFGQKEDFLQAAKLLRKEPKEISEKIKAALDQGKSYAAARAEAWDGVFSKDFLSSPNNILAIEYTKAILSQNSDIEIIPIKRIGGNYADEKLAPSFSSATAIRKCILDKNIDALVTQIPNFVYKDIPKAGIYDNDLEKAEKIAVLSRNTNELAAILDCTEGLENALKKAATSEQDFVSSLTSKRYTASRIRRILLHNLLKIEKAFILDCLNNPLYLKILAIKKHNTTLLSILSKSDYPILCRANDEKLLLGIQAQCYHIDKFAEDMYFIISSKSIPKKEIFIE